MTRPAELIAENGEIMTSTTKRRFLFVAVSLLALTGVVRYGNSLLILLESDAPSRS